MGLLYVSDLMYIRFGYFYPHGAALCISTTPLRSPYMPRNTRQNRPAVKRGAVAIKYMNPFAIFCASNLIG